MGEMIAKVYIQFSTDFPDVSPFNDRWEEGSGALSLPSGVHSTFEWGARFCNSPEWSLMWENFVFLVDP